MLNQEQLDFTSAGICNLKLLGIPGGGKSTSIIEHINQNIKDKSYLNSKEYLIITFSRKAKEEFKKQGKLRVGAIKFGNCKTKRQAFVNTNVRTIHSVAGTVNKLLLNKQTASINTTVLAALRILNQSLSPLTQLKTLNQIKMIYVDEAQDINKNQYNFILKMKEIFSCKVSLIGDPNQNIYQFQGGSDEFLLSYNADKVIQLVVNYRSQPSLVSFINELQPCQLSKMVSGRTDTDLSQQHKPQIIIGSVVEIARDIIEKIRILTPSVELSDIAIISPVKFCRPTDTGYYVNLGLSLFRAILNQFKIPFVQHYSDSGSKHDSLHNAKRVKNHINLLTIHGSKGLEFHTVFLVNFHHKIFGRLPTKKAYEISRYLLYVGVSRAGNQLFCYIDETKQSPYDLSKIGRETHDIKLLNPSIEFSYNGDLKLAKMETNYDDSPMISSFIETLSVENEFDLIDTFSKVSAVHTNACLSTNAFLSTEIQDDFRVILREHQGLIKSLMKNAIVCAISPSKFINKIKLTIEQTVTVPINFENAYRKLILRSPRYQQEFNFSKLYENRLLYSRSEQGLIRYILTQIKSTDKTITLIKYNNLFFQNTVEIVAICDELLELTSFSVVDDLIIEKLFRLTLHEHQKTIEAGYLMNTDLTDMILVLKPYVKNNMLYAIELNSNTGDIEFDKEIDHTCFVLSGIADMIYNDTITLFRFDTGAIPDPLIYRLLLLRYIYEPAFLREIKCFIVNLYNGTTTEWTFNIPDKLQFVKLLCSQTKTKLQSTKFVYDLETTGINTSVCEITERYVYEPQLNIIASNGLVKIIQSYIPSCVENLTGITKEMTALHGDFVKQMRNEIYDIFKYCDNPLFIAHNGNVFDHQIMKRYKMFPDEEYTTDDSRSIIRMLGDLPDDTIKMSLSIIYQNITSKTIPKSIHSGETDVKMLCEILVKIGYLKLH